MTEPSVERIAAVHARIARLEADLTSARAELVELESDIVSGPRTSAAVARVTAKSTNAEKVALFRKRFEGRQDVYALPWVSRRTGKKG